MDTEKKTRKLWSTRCCIVTQNNIISLQTARMYPQAVLTGHLLENVQSIEHGCYKTAEKVVISVEVREAK